MLIKFHFHTLIFGTCLVLSVCLSVRPFKSPSIHLSCQLFFSSSCCSTFSEDNSFKPFRVYLSDCYLMYMYLFHLCFLPKNIHLYVSSQHKVSDRPGCRVVETFKWTSCGTSHVYYFSVLLLFRFITKNGKVLILTHRHVKLCLPEQNLNSCFTTTTKKNAFSACVIVYVMYVHTHSIRPVTH